MIELRISTTTAEEFNKYLNWSCDECNGFGVVTNKKTGEEEECSHCHGDGRYYNEDQLITQLTKKWEPSKYADLGIAFHEIIQQPEVCYNRYVDMKCTRYGEIGFMAKNGIAFPYKVIADVAYKVIDHRFPFEYKLTKVFNFGNIRTTIVGKVDQIKGLEVEEYKSVWSYFKPAKFINSIQWKFYGELFGVQKINYKVFLFSLNKFDDIQYNDLQEFSMFPYEGMEEDNAELIAGFSRFIVDFKLTDLFKPYY